MRGGRLLTTPTPHKVMDGQRCAAGDLCSAPPGSDLSLSTHRCLECGNKIHCTIWCGKSISELTGSKITADRLSANGSTRFKTADPELTCICKGCIKRLDPSALLDPTDHVSTLPPFSLDPTDHVSTLPPVVVIRNVVSTTAGMKRKDNPNSTMMGNSTKSNYTISTELGEAMDAVNSDFETSEIDGEVVDMIIKYKLLHPPASCKAKWWKHFMKFGLTHFDKKDHAACKICFSQKNYSKGTVSTKGGGTGGLVRHLKRHHLTEYEVLDRKSGERDSQTTIRSSASGSIVAHFKSKPKQVSVEDSKKLFSIAAAAFAIKEAVPFSMFAKPAFRKMFTVVNKKASQIVNIGPERVRDQVMKFGLIAERATKLELNGVKIAWTTDHWTSPNDQSFTTLTAHYIDNIWQMRSACLDFKVFHGTTTGDKIYEDVKSVLARYKSETIMLVEDKIVDTIVDTIGITDTTGNMGVLGRKLRENGQEHAYCTDHNFHLNAKLAFDG